MSWTKSDYPESMKNLSTETRNKAIEIANALLDDNYEEGRAISIAISQAEKMNTSNEELPYHIVPHNDEWAIKRENATRATEVFSTKEKALDKARDLVKNKNVQLTIHRQDGTIEKVQYAN
ncbi:uncharacterized protein YdaT [Metabacillus crassostreae]|uniref:DUF2188 domain-containing protein n=1 Tax=Metabacillus crassostreae TaxID=929098 RepID=UPI00195C6329|nr:DUF2188 domain-containing protein [Metabacillus crassostreae]MBM7605597.1 uncharacterized protein YdaT [Metabacillus crassostreae]